MTLPKDHHLSQKLGAKELIIERLDDNFPAAPGREGVTKYSINCVKDRSERPGVGSSTSFLFLLDRNGHIIEVGFDSKDEESIYKDTTPNEIIDSLLSE